MEITPESVKAVLKREIASSQKRLIEAGFVASLVRERVAALAQGYGDPVLDVGTGACACLAVAMARKELKVTAMDHASSAVRIAQERAAGKLAHYLDIRQIDAAQMPFPDGGYRVVTAFDALCHAAEPAAVLGEMFRVSSKAVIITELNAVGRDITRHLDGGFDERLPDLLSPFCRDCQLFEYDHHVIFVCERTGTNNSGLMLEGG